MTTKFKIMSSINDYSVLVILKFIDSSLITFDDLRRCNIMPQKLEEVINLYNERNLWNKIKYGNNINEFLSFLQKYSIGRYANQAKIMVDYLKAEDKAWREMKSKVFADYTLFLKCFPDGVHKNEAEYLQNGSVRCCCGTPWQERPCSKEEIAYTNTFFPICPNSSSYLENMQELKRIMTTLTCDIYNEREKIFEELEGIEKKMRMEEYNYHNQMKDLKYQKNRKKCHLSELNEQKGQQNVLIKLFSKIHESELDRKIKKFNKEIFVFGNKIRSTESWYKMQKTNLINKKLFLTEKYKIITKKCNQLSVEYQNRVNEIKQVPHEVVTSVFAPMEVKKNTHLLVQVYLHFPEETKSIIEQALKIDRNTYSKGYMPLMTKIKLNDLISIRLNINSDKLIFSEERTAKWSCFSQCFTFSFLVSEDIHCNDLSCSVDVYVNKALAGNMMFVTDIVESPNHKNANVTSVKTKKLFVSYSHKDIVAAEKIAKIHEALGIDVFFDKHRLKAGYIYSEEISKFIKTADTFVLCWSKNAAKSDYVRKERLEALALAYPQRMPREQACLNIHPYNIEPYTAPPADMIENYHFEKL